MNEEYWGKAVFTIVAYQVYLSYDTIPIEKRLQDTIKLSKYE